jgi:competence ComEA-like helix-hairpin-helix protein
VDRKTLSGGTLLLILNILFASGLFVYENYLQPEPELELKEYSLPETARTSKSPPVRPDTLFPFDPNELGPEGWEKLGLSEEEAKVLIEYRKSGARFYDEKDLLEVYSVGEKELEVWKDYLRFPDPVDREGEWSRTDREEEVDDGKNEEEERIELFSFDPNQLSKKGWVRLGLSPRQAEVVISYRKKGGTFWEASDLLELYVVDSTLYRIWKDSVRIDRQALKIPIDRADEEELKELRGIGKARAGRIVEYRKLLGGFHAIEQLEEVYGIPDSVLGVVRPRVRIAGPDLAPLPLDTTAERLMQHPYIDPGTAERILEYRERYGGFQEKEELREMDLFSEEEYRKIAPYLRLSSHER